MSARDIYDFEGIVESAAQAVLKELNVTAATTQDAPTFQKVRPRVEIEVTLGPGLQRWTVYPPATGTGAQRYNARRESAWQFNIKFYLLTDFDIKVHSDYRATVRAALAQLWININGVAPMTRHSVQMTKDGGSSPVIPSPEKNMLLTQIGFGGTISVQADAWPALAT